MLLERIKERCHPLKTLSTSGTLSANSKGLVPLPSQNNWRRTVINIKEDEKKIKITTDLELVLSVILSVILKIRCQIHERMEKNMLGMSLSKSMFGKPLLYEVDAKDPACLEMTQKTSRGTKKVLYWAWSKLFVEIPNEKVWWVWIYVYHVYILYEVYYIFLYLYLSVSQWSQRHYIFLTCRTLSVMKSWQQMLRTTL